jgi:hypothetical protein
MRSNGENEIVKQCNKNKFASTHAAKTYGEVELQLHSILISALDGAECSTLHAGRFKPSNCSGLYIEEND